MSKFFNAKVSMKDTEQLPNGKERVKKWQETYLVEAVSVTDVEVIVTKEFKNSVIEWELKSVTESNIVDILRP